MIALRDGVVAFVEVKTRRQGPQSAAEALGRSQRRRIRRAAEGWIHEHPGLGREFRFDLISVDLHAPRAPRLRHIEGAFWGDEVR